MQFLLATVGAVVAGVVLSGPTSPAAAEPLLVSPSAPQETIGKAAAGEPKPYRSELVSDCGASQCILDFGKKQKARTLSLVNCAAAVPNGVAIVGEVRLSDPEAVVGYMGQISKALAGTVEYTVYEYDHRAVVAGGRRLTVVVSATSPMTAMRCIIDGTID
jgi:hypothetical protein